MINIVLLYINICLLFTFFVILYNNLINSDYGFVHFISLIIFVQIPPPQLQESRNFKKRIRRLEDANKKLALELEHEKGRLSGLGKSHSALREHANILEAALAKREADLVQLNLQV